MSLEKLEIHTAILAVFAAAVIAFGLTVAERQVPPLYQGDPASAAEEP